MGEGQGVSGGQATTRSLCSSGRRSGEGRPKEVLNTPPAPPAALVLVGTPDLSCARVRMGRSDLPWRKGGASRQPAVGPANMAAQRKNYRQQRRPQNRLEAIKEPGPRQEHPHSQAACRPLAGPHRSQLPVRELSGPSPSGSRFPFSLIGTSHSPYRRSDGEPGVPQTPLSRTAKQPPEGGQHVGRRHRACPCQGSCPHPRPPQWGPEPFYSSTAT